MKNNFIIFLISGKAHSGKSTVANIIKKYYEEYNQKIIITGFAKYIKLYAHEIIAWDYKEETKPRKFLQDIGFTVRNKLDNNIFINRMLEDIKVYENYANGVIISDVRFRNEIEQIKNKYQNVISINIVSKNSQLTLNEEEKKHISEHDLDDYKNFDYVINNDSDIKDLEQNVFNVLEKRK